MKKYNIGSSVNFQYKLFKKKLNKWFCDRTKRKNQWVVCSAPGRPSSVDLRPVNPLGSVPYSLVKVFELVVLLTSHGRDIGHKVFFVLPSLVGVSNSGAGPRGVLLF
jgi:hypothetical protein